MTPPDPPDPHRIVAAAPATPGPPSDPAAAPEGGPDRPTVASASERELLDKAITFLNHHVPAYGDRPYGGEDAAAWKNQPEDKIAAVPESVRVPLAEALGAAARFAARVFANDLRAFDALRPPAPGGCADPQPDRERP